MDSPERQALLFGISEQCPWLGALDRSWPLDGVQCPLKKPRKIKQGLGVDCARVLQQRERRAAPATCERGALREYSGAFFRMCFSFRSLLMTQSTSASAKRTFSQRRFAHQID